MGHIAHMAVLLSVTTALLLALPMAHAASPYSQFESGVSLEEILCMDEKVLMESSRGTPACVKESSAEKLVQRGFVLVTQMTDKIKPTTEQPPLNSVPDKPDDPAMQEPVMLDVVSGNNRFAVDFYKQVSDNDENIFFSPFSMYVAFSALYEGARHDTAEQIRNVFGLNPDSEIRHNSTRHLVSHINQKDQYTTLSMANALWLADWLTVNDTYAESVRKFYDADVERLDLPAVGEKRIDDWAAENTNGLITNVIEPGDLTSETATVLTNAIYFAGEWRKQFPIENTRPWIFWKNSEESVDVEMMFNEWHFHHASFDDVQVLKMPYKGDRLSMLVILPDDRDGIRSLEEFITADMIEQWRSNMDFRKVEILMPKFTMETEYLLERPLSHLGMRDVFEEGLADLSGISDFPQLYLGKASQKAFVDVDEVGTKAAAVTVLPTDAISGPVSFKATHPFIFVIQDDKTGAILFMGRLSDPTM